MKIMSKYMLVAILSFVSISLTVAKGEIDILNIKDDESDIFVEYTGSFNFNNMHCIFSINGLLFTTSTLILPKGWKLENMQLSDDIGGHLHQGANNIEIRGIQVPTLPKEGTISYCEMSIYASAINRRTGETGGEEVSHLRLSIDESGKFTAEQSRNFPEPSVIDELQLFELDEKAINIDWLNNDTVVRRNLQIDHRHDSFAWTKAKSFENTPESIARLWEAYDELTAAFSAQDLERIEQLILPAGKERDRYTGYTGMGSRRVEERLLSYQRLLNQHGFTPSKIDRNDYELEIADHGKLFRFNYKGGFNSSPIIYDIDGGKSYGTINYYFTEIDGKIRVGVL
ncbi:hypothetical protein [Ignatzschineria sp. LJL83]